MTPPDDPTNHLPPPAPDWATPHRPEAPATVPKREGARRFWVVVLCAVVFWFGTDRLLVHSETFLRFAVDQTFTIDSLALDVEGRLRLAPPGRTSVALIGSSVLLFGVRPEPLAKRLKAPPRSVRAFALPGGHAFELAMLADHLARLASPVVVYMATTDLLHPEVILDRMRFYDPGMAWRIFSPGELLAEHAFHAGGVLSSTHFAFRHRQLLREVALVPLLQVPAVRRALASDQVRRRSDFLDRMARRDPANMYCPNLKTRSLTALVERLQESGTRVLLMATPTNHPWDRNPAIVERLANCLGEIGRTTGADVFGPRRLPPFPPTLFQDSVHLDKVGRRRFQRLLADVLTDLYGQPRVLTEQRGAGAVR